jgi:hypothetical protein
LYARVDDWFDVLAQLGEQERSVSLAFVAGQSVVFDEDALRGALRRAMLLRATGGDPHRELALDEPSVTRFAAELDAPEHRQQLQLGLATLRDASVGNPQVVEAIAALLSDPELAWHCLAAARIAAELAEED